MLKLATVSLVMLLSVAARAASPAPRVVILDALQLTSGLERINTHQRILEAVTAAVKEHGWEPVSGTTECHNLTCAGLLAANAKANYVLALLGAYDPPAKYTSFYANEVGVSLWRDGGIIASRTEADEQADFDKAGGGAFAACGPPTGTCTAPLLIAKLVQYAAKLVDNETAARRAREAAAAAAVHPAVAAQPVTPVVVVPPAPAPARVEDSGVGQILGWSLVGAGAVLVGGGIALWVFNNSGSDCHSLGGDAAGCRQTRSTFTAGGLVGGAGLIAAAAGVVLLVIESGPSKVALTGCPGGLVLGGRF